MNRYGLFDAKVPRYTSYPPANRFEPEVGRAKQTDWLRTIDPGKPVSIYVHIPFCRRLCWFCACRTQGTQTLRPVAAYVDDVVSEIDAVCQRLPFRPDMARLHLGGGTPTLLSVPLMDKLLGAIFNRFAAGSGFEFSVEIDPTEAELHLLDRLAEWHLNRASIGVQDFSPDVQRAIGREQSVSQTAIVAGHLRTAGVRSLNLDLLYGLPKQTDETLLRTLEQVRALAPDRLALYGYAHVPHMSKRQVMIDSDAVPGTRQRLKLFELAEHTLGRWGYQRLGLDHFALPSDSLAIAASEGRMRRNFQGHTDDPCETLIGFGASAISRFPHGYTQNAVSTAAYRSRVQSGGLAAHKGYAMSRRDHVVADMIERLMCDGAIDLDDLSDNHPDQADLITANTEVLLARFPEALTFTNNTLHLPNALNPLSRIIAAALDSSAPVEGHHSLAV